MQVTEKNTESMHQREQSKKYCVTGMLASVVVIAKYALRLQDSCLSPTKDAQEQDKLSSSRGCYQYGDSSLRQFINVG